MLLLTRSAVSAAAASKDSRAYTTSSLGHITFAHAQCGRSCCCPWPDLNRRHEKRSCQLSYKGLCAPRREDFRRRAGPGFPGWCRAPVLPGHSAGLAAVLLAVQGEKMRKKGVIALLSRLNFSSCQACFPFASCAKLCPNICLQCTNSLLKICESVKILGAVHRTPGTLQPHQHVTSPCGGCGRGAGLDLHACNAHLNGDLLPAVHGLLQAAELFISQ